MMKVVMFLSSLFFVITNLPNASCDEFLLLGYSCSNSSTFNTSSTYNSSVNAVLRSFFSNATSNSVGYYHTTAGNTTENTVHGYYLCRGDLNRSSCRACMSEALNNLPSRRERTYCPRSKVETLYYDKCMFRYDSQTLYQKMSQEYPLPEVTLGNITGIPQDIDFKSFLREKLDDLAWQAASNETGKKYAAIAMYVGAFKPLFALAQCTPDLTVQECHLCLLSCNGRLNMDTDGEKFFVASCNVRYESYSFFEGAINLLASSPRPGRPSLVSNTAINNTGKRNISIGSIIGIVAAAAIIAIILTSGVMCFTVKKMIANQMRTVLMQHGNEDEGLTVESLQYNLTSLQSATNNFSEENKLGEGGFGIVYKGTLLNGKDIAVKRLSKSASQGEEQFKNEVLLVAKLQHRNLVRLLGYCLTEEEKLLIYEFVPNQSLDKFLFDPEMSKQWDWKRRYNVIEGIARGMLYLHEDSRLKIIHRDLKASNILVDAFMNPKISDFGTARIFGVDQTKGSTKRVIGTYGYMAPEYVLYGQFSVKSDVYSFGVLVLEIISGEKSYKFSERSDESNLLSFAWKNWSNDTPLQFVDPCIRDGSSAEEVARCMQLALLCVHQDANERPFMSTIVLMLSSLTASIPLPSEPRLFASTDTHPTFTGINHYSTSDDALLQFPADHDDDVSLTLPR